MIDRSLTSFLIDILEKDRKLAFLSGPRQVGKTTLAHSLQKRYDQSFYFNWDNVEDQKRLIVSPFFFRDLPRDPRKPFLLIFDEIHKFARWKNYLKGVYDQYRGEFSVLVTGSGRLDLFKRGQDSLLGRYVRAPLFPLSVGEIGGQKGTWKDFKEGLKAPLPSKSTLKGTFETLFNFSGFPEPFSKGDTAFYGRWRQERRTSLIRGDIRDTSRVREISLIESLSHLIPDRVGSPLSLNSLREDLSVAFETVRDWVLLLEHFYFLFRISPYAGSLQRTLRKEPKVYLFDWVEVTDPAIRFENVVALHLYKAVQIWTAMGEGDIALHYVRDKEKREVDFCLTERGKPFCLIECINSDRELAPALLHFQKQFSVPTVIQLVQKTGVLKRYHRDNADQWVISADQWLSLLP